MFLHNFSEMQLITQILLEDKHDW